MVGQIVELASEGRRIGLERGFLTVTSDMGVGRVAIDDVEAVIASAQGLTYSNAILAALAERGAPLVICGKNYAPTAVLLSLDGHYEQGHRIAAQATASKPVSKQLWAQLVRAKIVAQSLMLARFGENTARLDRLADQVKSGDPDNLEAQAAQAYWPLLLGKDFRRNRDGSDINTFLNYGYAVLRAASARAIAGSGLHPSLSIHHQSRGEALRLADDIMEPFRPAVDYVAKNLWAAGENELTPQVKLTLAKVLQLDYQTTNGRTPLSVCLSRLCNSLARVYLKETDKLDLPKPLIPIKDSGQ
ncbi:type II CRISPR-associated endonuclease Cas1 [Asticcacaulis endophyticus]|uniref:CRISPR-associated endonuclease Cas1 n=1 Tax=Asticcacaulis endophyticus TaxID=1395890 RepID=A0A918Q554_9CAUL|nr:type II CRISPR-associated endonuclease Cas1 [Asticcacaulis endophyticus]GGZ32971.1 CRISPR-associated endonuclease Cas1 [Asticcacaulis endophyticus]